MSLDCIYSAIALHPSEILAFLALLVSGLSFWLSFRSHRRTGRYERFQHATRLQLVDEHETGYSPGIRSKTGKGFRYSTKLRNIGMQPVRIEGVFIDCGARDDPQKRRRRGVEGRFYLSPGEDREIQFDMSATDVDEIMEQFQGECLFFLRVVYHTAAGDAAEAHRILGGYEGDTGVIAARGGDILI